LVDIDGELKLIRAALRENDSVNQEGLKIIEYAHRVGYDCYIAYEPHACGVQILGTKKIETIIEQ